MRVLVFLAIVILAICEKVSYKDWKGIQVVTPTEHDVKVVRAFQDLGVKLLHEPSTQRACEIAVPPTVFDVVVAELKSGQFNYTLLYDDLEALIEMQAEESKVNSKIARFRSGGMDDSIATYFPTYRQAEDWMIAMTKRFPALAQIIRIGKSFERRDQIVLKVGTAGTNKPVLWIDGGIHAREWATVPTVLYIAYRLLNGYGSGDTKALLDRYDFYFLPIFNPDGYVHTHTVDRFWRKNRRPNQFGGCPGVDLNRNFGHQWGVSGISRRSCDDAYLGEAPFSEPETQNVRDALLSFRGRLLMYLNLHAYGQLWFIPYGFNKMAPHNNPHDLQEQTRVATIAANAIRSTSHRNTVYRVGKPGNLLYDAAGGTFDWAYAVAGAKYAFAAELSPSLFEADGLRGFDMLPNQILGVAQEVYNGVRAAVEAMRY